MLLQHLSGTNAVGKTRWELLTTRAPLWPSAPPAKSASACSDDGDEDTSCVEQSPCGSDGGAPPAFDVAVQQLLDSLLPAKEESDIELLARSVQDILWLLLPEAQVVGVRSCEADSNMAVEIVVVISPDVLVERLQTRLSKGGAPVDTLDVRKLQKSAIRACIDLLVAKGGFKFRRSSFRDDEPKVVLLAPAALIKELAISEHAVVVTLGVNIVTPLYHSALLSGCGQIDPRSRQLVEVVLRWAKCRRLCHSGRGHLSPYTWSILALYFLQVGVTHCGAPLLPALQASRASSGAFLCRRAPPAPGLPPASSPVPLQRACETRALCTSPHLSMGWLFKEFVRFYATKLDWHNEAISVRAGRRLSMLDMAFLPHAVQAADGHLAAGPSIEDPFCVTHNLGASASAENLGRLHEEFSRAQSLLDRDCSLRELLEPFI